MTTTRGSAHYAGLLPVSVRLTTLENESGQPSFRKRASRALSLIAFCAGVAATFAWWSYGDATGHSQIRPRSLAGWPHGTPQLSRKLPTGSRQLHQTPPIRGSLTQCWATTSTRCD
jgi:hypothetical protein